MTGVDSDSRETAYRLATYVAIGFSVLSALLFVVTVPAMYSEVNNAQQDIVSELDSCQSIFQSVSLSVRVLQQKARANRTARQLNFGPYGMPITDFVQGIPQFGQLGGCVDGCIPGPQGPSGSPGKHGIHGRPGEPGKRGRDGKPALNVICTPPEILPCPECPAGPPGLPGLQGPLGDAGAAGLDGRDGKNGIPGEPGYPGDVGVPGKPGEQGERGEMGRKIEGVRVIPGEPGDAGPPGMRGKIGFVGTNGANGIPERGEPGLKGLPGLQGKIGERGLTGQPGADGSDGEEGVCPTYCANDGGVFYINPVSLKLEESPKKKLANHHYEDS